MWAMPTFIILTLIYWLHLIATVIWLGGLAALALIIWPGLIQKPGNDPSRSVLDAIERRFWPLANVSLVMLIVTGTLQMSVDPHYKGFLTIDSPWAIGLLAKHIVIVGIIVASVAIQWSVQPALERAAMLSRRGDAAGQKEEAALRRRTRQLTLVSFGLGILVLMLTAYITAL
jgi:uncharacterized membrane protein